MKRLTTGLKVAARGVAIGLAVACAQALGAGGPSNEAFEVNVGYSPFALNITGEPSLVVDPKNPDHLVMILMSSTQSFKDPAGGPSGRVRFFWR